MYVGFFLVVTLLFQLHDWFLVTDGSLRNYTHALIYLLLCVFSGVLARAIVESTIEELKKPPE
jgi:hypothetical protein